MVSVTPSRLARAAATPYGGTSALVWATYRVMPCRSSSATTWPWGSSVSTRDLGRSQRGWWATIRSLPAAAASATTAAVQSTVQVIWVTAAARDSTVSPTTSQLSASRDG